MSELEWMKIFADNLRSLMEESHMSQRELARKSRLTESQISKYLNCQCMPSVHALVNIAYAFPLATVNDLLCFYERLDPRPSRRW